MTGMYGMLGLSRQSVSQKLHRMSKKAIVANTVLDLASDIRKKHPKMGCRKMYLKIADQIPLGRDQCEDILLSSGFRVQFPPNFRRTTYSIGKLYHPNLIEGLKVDGLNQVWQTDITYFEVDNKFYYLVFIEDIYSRRIVGWSVDHSMWAQANLRSLQQAIDLRGPETLKGLIHHSDRGGQYIDREYVHKLRNLNITPSMSKFAWQNAYCERLNGIIKNEYLKSWTISGLAQLDQAVNNAVHLYNHDRPHRGLPYNLSPIEFEDRIMKGLFRIKPTMTLYSPKVDT
jgi:putative transposase